MANLPNFADRGGDQLTGRLERGTGIVMVLDQIAGEQDQIRRVSRYPLDQLIVRFEPFRPEMEVGQVQDPQAAQTGRQPDDRKVDPIELKILR